jgi:hypothetical protein
MHATNLQISNLIFASSFYHNLRLMSWMIGVNCNILRFLKNSNDTKIETVCSMSSASHRWTNVDFHQPFPVRLYFRQQWYVNKPGISPTNAATVDLNSDICTDVTFDLSLKRTAAAPLVCAGRRTLLAHRCDRLSF